MKQNKQRDDSESEIYISVDIEASGPIPSKYSMLSIGACVVGNDDNRFYAEIKPINDSFDPEAIKISGFTIDYLKSEGLDPQTALKSFAIWIENISKNRIPIFVGFNAPFDWQFVNWYFIVYTGSNPFGINAIDIKAYFMGAAHTSWRKTSSSNMPDWLKVENKEKHNALSDAISQAVIFDRLLKWSDER
jgi:DNA polymerase III epsilon subunit-like protein